MLYNYNTDDSGKITEKKGENTLIISPQLRDFSLHRRDAYLSDACHPADTDAPAMKQHKPSQYLLDTDALPIQDNPSQYLHV